MKLLIIATLFALTLSAQQSRPSTAQGERQQPVILAEPQTAKTVTINLSADAATVWESYRLSTPGERDTHGISAPQFKNVDELINFAVTQVTKQLIQRFPTAAVQAAQAAQTAAAKAATDAAAKALGQ